MVKKVILLYVSILIFISLTACGGGEPEPSENYTDLSSSNFSVYYNLTYSYDQYQVGTTIMWAVDYSIKITPTSSSVDCENCFVTILGDRISLPSSGSKSFTLNDSNLQIGTTIPSVQTPRVTYASGQVRK